jgi:putative heme degradation protein
VAFFHLAPINVGVPKNMQALFRQAQRDAEEMQMRIGIGIAVVLAIGLIWSVAAMSEWVPVVSAG